MKSVKRKPEGESSAAACKRKKTGSRQREIEAANAEIKRLKLELEALRAEGCVGSMERERKRAEGAPILPKRALTLAGYWNVLSNDILYITPLLVALVENKGRTVLRRSGMHVCFYAKDKQLVVESVIKLMQQHLPQYRRRLD